VVAARPGPRDRSSRASMLNRLLAAAPSTRTSTINRLLRQRRSGASLHRRHHHRRRTCRRHDQERTMTDTTTSATGADTPAGILDQLRAAAAAWMRVPRVRHYRSRRLSPAQRNHLAAEAGVSFPVVARLMRGEVIKVEQAEAIARAVGAEFRLVPVAPARSGAA